MQDLWLADFCQPVPTAPIEPLLSAAEGNLTALQTQISPSWVSTSGERGTSDILWSCILTLTACVYTAIHLNIPPAHEGKLKFIWRKAKWVALALFAPEIVLYCALTQLIGARKLVKQLDDLWAAQQVSPDFFALPESSHPPPDVSNKTSSSDFLGPSQPEQDHVSNDTPPSPSPGPGVRHPEENNEDNDIPPSSGDNAENQTSNQLPQRSPSKSSTRSASGQVNLRGRDLEKGEKGSISLPSKRFSLRYGFFVVMGGVITHDVAKIHDKITGPITLTPNAVITFARNGRFFDLSPELISNKSKSNLLGKSLVCIQVAWFLIQCIARGAAGYPLVLLEVHTMVHVVCALLMYAFWWEKPQDVSDPTVQDVSNDLDSLAALSSNTRLPDHDDDLRKEILSLVWYGDQPTRKPTVNKPSNDRPSSGHNSSDTRYDVKVLRDTPYSHDLKYFDTSKGQVAALVPGQALSCGIGPGAIIGETLDEISYLSTKDVLRWEKLAEWFRKYEQRNPTVNFALPESERLVYKNSLYWRSIRPSYANPIIPNDALSVYASDLPGKPAVFCDRDLWVDAMAFLVNTKVLLALLVTLPLIYGGIHLSAWKFRFASQTESLLWKVACIDIMGTIPMCAIVYGCIRKKWYSFHGPIDLRFLKSSPLHFALFAFTWTFYSLAFVSYTLSRTYIVVESFVSLRHVPIGVYAAIPWVQDIPHV